MKIQSLWLTIVALLLTLSSLEAQTYTMSSTSITTCGGTYLDPGGTGNYGNNQNITQTITPVGVNDKLVINFNSFSTESCCDRLRIYDGNSTAAPLIGTFAGTSIPSTITSTATDGSLTFQFTSDGSVTRFGWSATFSCCNTANVGVVSSNRASICAGETVGLSVTNYCGSIQWQSSTDNITWSNTTSTGAAISELPSEAIFYRAIATLGGVTDTSATLFVNVNCYLIGGTPTTTTCSGTFYDSGKNGNYSNNQNITQTFFPQNATDKLQISFVDFNTESCCDRLIIYNGNSTSAPVLGIYRGSTLPPNLSSTAADGSLTFSFISDGSNTGRGWEANFSCCNTANAGSISSSVSTVCAGQDFELTAINNCGTIQWESSTDNVNWTGIVGNTPILTTSQLVSSFYRTIVTLNGVTDTSAAIFVTTDCYEMGDLSTATTCSGTFYDSGKNGNYSNNQNITQTFFPQNATDKLQISFVDFNTESCCDRLIIYNGNSTSAPVLGIYRGSTLPPNLSSTAADGSLTFSFISDGSNTGRGWEANFSCCNTANAGSISSSVSTVCAGQDFELLAVNNCGTIQWESSTDNVNWTGIGGNTPVLTTNQLVSSFYRTIVTLNGVTDTSAAIFVTTDCYEMGDLSTATTCSGTFYDSGKNGNYSNNQNITQTFFPQNATNKLQISFVDFNTESCCDRLIIYNGNSTSAPVLGIYRGSTLPPNLSSTAADGSLTFSFISDGSNTGRGWEANFSCCNTANAGSISSSVSTVCAGQDFELTAINNCGTIQWESSTDNVNWTGIVGNTPILTTNQLVSSFYRTIVTLNGVTDTSTTTFVTTDCYEMGDLSTATTCSGTFYDSGKNGNYSNNQNITQTFFPQNATDKLQISFVDFNTESCCDRLIIYNGNSTSAPVLGIYRGSTLPPNLSSTAADGSLTFSFISDGSNTGRGWEANFSCCNTANAGSISPSVSNVCGGDDFELSINNNCGTVVWQASVDNINWNSLPNTTPIITTSQLESSFYRVIATLNGISDTSNAVFVTTDCYEIGDLPSATTCNAFFYDSGNNNGNYQNNENRTQTFFPANPSAKLGIVFTSFNTESCCDRLIIYDGNSTAAPVIGTYRGTALPPNINSTAADGSLTFQFISDGSATRSGWEATIFCNCDTNQTYLVTHAPLTDACTNQAPFTLVGGNPSGGTYTGTGVTGNDTFDPALAGTGTFQLTYTYSTPGGCTGDTTVAITVVSNGSATRNISICQGDSYSMNGISYTTSGTYLDTISNVNTCDSFITLNLTVNPLPTVQLTGLNSTYCTSDGIVTPTISPLGGNLTGPGVNLGNFDPVLAGVGTHIITYSYTDNNGCTNSTSNSVTVISGGGSSSSATICQGDNYTWQGNTYNSAGTYFDTLTAINGCDSILTLNLTVNPLPNVQLAGLNNTNYCPTAPPVSLTGGTPTGGSYSGTGVSGNTFDPAQAGTGVHTITYTYTDNNGCTNTASTNVTVFPSNTTTLPVSVCQGTVYAWQGNTYTTSGIYRDTITASTGCDSILVLNLTVNPNPVVSLTGLNSNSYCSNDMSVTLVGSPAGGSYAGAGVNGNIFDPSIAGTGNAIIVYSYTDANNCTSTAIDSAMILPTSSSSQSASICQGDSYTWQGNTYNSAGSYQATLTAANGCDSILTLNLSVNPLPSVQLVGLNNGGTYCLSSNPVSLIGSPSGGVFAGNGINNGTFDPSLAGVGVHTISYTYTDPNGCTNVDNATVSVVSQTTNTQNAAICQGDSYTWQGNTYSTAGQYRDTLINTNGCDSILILDLVVNPLPNVQIVGLDTVYCDTINTVVVNTIPATGGVLSGSGVSGNQFSPRMATLGFNTLVYTYTDNNNCTNSTSATTRVKICNINTIDAVAAEQRIKLYPNPTTGWITIERTQDVPMQIMVFGEDGKLLLQQSTVEQNLQLELVNFASGVYFVRLVTDKETTYKKVILIKD